MSHKTYPEDFTALLQGAQAGDSEMESRFCDLVNEELRRAAASLVRRRQGPDQATSLVDEVFIRLFRVGVTDDLKNRRYFFAVAIDQMRQILRDRCRKRASQKAGGHLNQQPLDVVLDQYLGDFNSASNIDFLVFDEALEGLRDGGATTRQFEVLKLHYYMGLEQKRIAELLGVNPPVVSKDLKAAKAKLAVRLKGDSG